MQTSSALNGVFILSFSISAENAGIADSVAVQVGRILTPD
jgi:hypothetical protein